MKVPNFRWSSFNTVLATLSLSCQSLVDVVHPHTNMPEPCSLYLLAIAEPGAGKTTINRLVMNPCYEFADRLIQQYEERNKDYKTELQDLEYPAESACCQFKKGC
ncbi:DUF3987 domain-containing protein [Escherichia coli]